MRSVFSRFVLTAIIATLALPEGAVAERSNIYNIGSGGLGGIFWPTGGKLCDLMNKSRSQGQHDFRCVVESTGGSISNIRGIKRGDLDLGLAQADLLYFAVEGTEHFEAEGASEDLRFIMSLNQNMMHVMARADAGISEISDLAGKRVNTGNVGSGTEAIANLMLPYFGIEPSNDFAVNSKLTMKEQGQALCDGNIHAFMQPTALSFAVGLETSNTCNTVMIPVDGAPAEKMFTEHPYYTRTTIPAGVYKGVDVDTETFGYPVVLVASKDVPDSFVYHLVKSMFDNFEEFKAQHPAYQSMSREESAMAGAMAPYHEGAARYYREVDLID